MMIDKISRTCFWKNIRLLDKSNNLDVVLIFVTNPNTQLRIIFTTAKNISERKFEFVGCD